MARANCETGTRLVLVGYPGQPQSQNGCATFMKPATRETAFEVGRNIWLVPVLALSLAIGAALAIGGADVVTWLSPYFV